MPLLHVDGKEDNHVHARYAYELEVAQLSYAYALEDMMAAQNSPLSSSPSPQSPLSTTPFNAKALSAATDRSTATSNQIAFVGAVIVFLSSLLWTVASHVSFIESGSLGCFNIFLYYNAGFCPDYGESFSSTVVWSAPLTLYYVMSCACGAFHIVYYYWRMIQQPTSIVYRHAARVSAVLSLVLIVVSLISFYSWTANEVGDEYFGTWSYGAAVPLMYISFCMCVVGLTCLVAEYRLTRPLSTRQPETSEIPTSPASATGTDSKEGGRGIMLPHNGVSPISLPVMPPPIPSRRPTQPVGIVFTKKKAQPPLPPPPPPRPVVDRAALSINIPSPTSQSLNPFGATPLSNDQSMSDPNSTSISNSHADEHQHDNHSHNQQQQRAINVNTQTANNHAENIPHANIIVNPGTPASHHVVSSTQS